MTNETPIRSFRLSDETMRELDQIAEKYIRGRGAIPVYKGYNGFPATICVAVNNVICHGFPSKTPLRQGDIVGIDIGAKLNGWVGDSCVTYPVGQISPDSASSNARSYGSSRRAQPSAAARQSPRSPAAQGPALCGTSGAATPPLRA